MEQGKVEPTLSGSSSEGLDPGMPIDSVGQPDAEPAPARRSWGGVGAVFARSRGAMILVGVASLAGVAFFVQHSRNESVEEVSNTDLAIPVPLGGGRNTSNERVAQLDAAVEAEALEKARAIGGSYMPPLGTEQIERPAMPDLPTKPAEPISQLPVPGQANANNQQLQAQAEAEKRRLEAIEKSMQKQLARLEQQVYRTANNPGVSISGETAQWLQAVSSGAAPASGAAETALGFPMGTIWGATLITGADTDRPGIVRAQLQEGPFAGREALCKFDWASREYLSLECFSIKLDTESFPVKMVAVDADTMPNLKANYDGRYIKRLGGQFLAAFPAAYAEGMSRGGSVTQGVGGTTTTEKELAGKDLLIYAGGQATAPLLDEAQQIASEIRPRASVPPMQSIGLMLAEDI